ncbi:hypothetical protein SAMN05660479_00846 [Microbulbifer thermotolerans]|nr:hypothetical protein SAMN05660479_00846 [Microbulbifer thermotolerans]
MDTGKVSVRFRMIYPATSARLNRLLARANERDTSGGAQRALRRLVAYTEPMDSECLHQKCFPAFFSNIANIA